MRNAPSRSALKRLGRLGLQVGLCALSATAVLELAACVAGAPAKGTAQAQRDAIASKVLNDMQESQEKLRRRAGQVLPEESVGPDGVQLVLTTGHSGGIAELSISSDGRYVASSDGQEVKIWDLVAHNEVRSFEQQQSPYSRAVSARISMDGRSVLQQQQTPVARLGQEQTLRDWATGTVTGKAQLFSEDGHVAITTGPPGSAASKNVGSAFTVTDLTSHRQSGVSVPAGSTLLSISAHGDTLLTNDMGVETGGGARGVVSGVLGLASLAASVVPGVGLLTKLGAGVAQSAVGDAPTDQRMTLLAWDARTGRKLVSVETTLMSNIAALDEAGKELLIENSDRSIDAYELPGAHTRRLVAADPNFQRPAFVHDTLLLSRDGHQFARANPSGAIEIFDTRSGQKRATLALTQYPQGRFPGVMPAAPRLLFSPDGKLVAASGSDRVGVWEIGSGNPILQTQAAAIAFSQDSRTVILGRADQGTPVLHDLGTGSEEAFAAHLSPVLHVEVTPDGRWAIATNAPPGGMKVWDLTTGELSANLTKCPDDSMVVSATSSPTRSQVAIQCANGAVRLWDPVVSNWGGELIPAAAATLAAADVNRFAGRRIRYFFDDRLRFSADGRYIAIARDEEVSVVDLASRVVVGKVTTAGEALPAQWDQVAQMQQQAVLMDAAGKDSALDAKTLKSMGKNEREQMQALEAQQRSSAADFRKQMSDPVYIEALRAAQRQISGVAIDSNRHVLATARGGLVSLWNFETGERLRVLNEPVATTSPAVRSGLNFSPDGSTLCAPGTERWSTLSGQRMTAPDACHDSTSAMLPDGSFTVVRPHGNLLALSVLGAGDLGELVGHRGAVSSIALLPGGKRVISASEDGSLRIWSVSDRKELLALYSLGGMDFVIMTPEQYYRASRSRLAGISFRVKDQLYPFEQFDLRYNRPDIVVERLGRASAQERAEYRSAREHRLKKMGFTEAMLSSDFHVPQAEIIGELPASKTGSDSLPLRVRVSDDRYPLDRINVFVNDVPVFGSRGVTVTDRLSKSYEQPLTVPLVSGINKIQVSVLNQQGAESLKRTVYTTSTAAPTRDVYLVAIGVSKYKDSKYNLRFAAKDAADVMSLYSNGAARGSGGQVHVLDLTNEKATRAQVEHAREWLAQSRPNDLVIVFAAGHGITDSQNNYYFGTYDIDPAQPQINGLPYEEFETLLDGIPAMKKVLLLDTCFSGEIEKADAPAVTMTAAVDGTVKMRAFQAPRGVVLAADTSNGPSTGAAGSGQTAVSNQHFQNLFADLRRGVGAVVISSASGNEYALEGDHWNNGVFTYAVLHGLKDGKADANKDGVVTVAELQNYVINAVRELTAGGQNPTVREANLDFDFQVY
ncbi:MAG TPA: caspase family protein [Steroidobacteraceae bacterium]|jgi:WD40 repeat protein/uncharacterized caspase-like protein